VLSCKLCEGRLIIGEEKSTQTNETISFIFICRSCGTEIKVASKDEENARTMLHKLVS
jgi:RNase P subunit RPR2